MLTQITIELVEGENYLSFPATSTDDFATIFTLSGIINNIPENQFTKLDPLTQNMIPINYTAHIEKGIGYKLVVNSPCNIIYDGEEFTMTFDEITSHLKPDWNLIGTGSNIIIPSSYCKIYDPYYNIVTELYPANAYRIHYSNCIEPSMNYGTTIAVVASSLVAFAILKQFKVL